MPEFDFPWNGDENVFAEYEKSNVKIKDTGIKNGKAIIFFSGNGLYFPNNYETFKKTIVEKDRYEWENIGNSKFIQKHFQRIIFVRDIFKQWYINGVSSSNNTIEKTVDYLKKITCEYKITCCGVSAGGYMAALAGSMLCADVIIDISGQWILNEDNAIYCYYSEKNGEGRRYTDLKEIISSSDKIFYFYPAKNEQDIAQYEHIKDEVKNVFAMNVKIHGSLLRKETFPHLLICSAEKLTVFCDYYKDKLIDVEDLFDKIVPFGYRIKYRAIHALHMVIEKLKKY